MGQQQLLLIVLAIMVVGLGIYGGLRMFEVSNQDNERDMIVTQMNLLVAEARTYAAKPGRLGGGDGSLLSFQNFVPKKMTKSTQFTINVTSGANWVLFQGVGVVNGVDGANPVQVIAQYDFSADFSSGSWTTMESVN